MAWSRLPLLRPGAVLMRPDDGGVDHRVLVVWIVRQRLEKILPRRRTPTIGRTACGCSSKRHTAPADRAKAPQNGIFRSPPLRTAGCRVRCCAQHRQADPEGDLRSVQTDRRAVRTASRPGRSPPPRSSMSMHWAGGARAFSRFGNTVATGEIETRHQSRPVRYRHPQVSWRTSEAAAAPDLYGDDTCGN